MDPTILLQYWPILLSGFELTIACWAPGTLFSMTLGLVISLAQRYGPRPLGWLIQAYIEVIRGTPFLVQLFVLYYGGPLLGRGAVLPPLEGLLSRRHEPEGIEPEGLGRHAADDQVAVMNGVE